MHTIRVGDDRIVVDHEVHPNDRMPVWNDAAARRLEGWRMLSVDTLVTGYTGSAAQLLLDTGGGSATAVRYTVLYERVTA